MTNSILLDVIIIMGILNMLRMLVYLIGGDLYNLKQQIKNKRRSRGRKWHTPFVSVIVPAHNEESTITKCLKSLVESNYPKSKLEIIVVNDGSTDSTAKLIRQFINENGDAFSIKLVNQKNAGKAAAFNRGTLKHSNGSIIMCLDADSMVEKMSIRRAVQYFRDRRTVAVASNVNIVEDRTLLSLIQRFEYLVAYMMKKAQSQYNIEYIVGGIGSYYRRSILDNVGHYDTNTVTEDMDLTLKFLTRGNKKHKIEFAYDAIVFTEPVATYKSLISQRFRLKYRSIQSIKKNQSLLFKKSSQHSKVLTFFAIPYGLIYHFIFVLEPVFLGYILYTSIRSENVSSVLFATLIIAIYLSINIWSTKHLSILQKIRLTLYSPVIYFLMYVVYVVEYIALVLTVLRLPKISASLKENFTVWKSAERTQP
ncbi:MAG TPA: glycosyltransferase [Candidatus Saccharimonadales bacterium]|nr:glycosyltransferase [Candidatus Saccharimonadales bacterium]